MAYFNKIIIIGNLTRDTEVTQTSTGASVCSFAIASNRPVKNKQTGEGANKSVTHQTASKSLAIMSKIK